jgi:hypothetical protein
MILCEFCILQQEGHCSFGHPTPKKMRCVDFAPGIERFCATPADYVGREQLRQMARFFGLTGRELARVLTMSESWKEERSSDQARIISEHQNEKRSA